MAERTGTQKDQESVVLNIHAAKVILALWVIAAGLVIASLVSQGIRFLFLDPRLRRLALLDLNAEGNIPTYFSTIILLFSSILLGTISMLKKKERDPYRVHWAVLSFLFFLVSFEEVASLRDYMDRPVQLLLGQNSSIFYFSWVIPGALFVVFIIVLFFPFWIHLPRWVRRSFAIAAGIYIFGVIGIESIGGAFIAVNDEFNFTYVLITTVEETLEMAGVILFIKALLLYLSMFYSDTLIRIRFRQR